MTETTDERIARIHQQISARMEDVIRECVEHCARIADEEEAMLDQVEDADLLERFRPTPPLTRH